MTYLSKNNTIIIRNRYDDHGLKVKNGISVTYTDNSIFILTPFSYVDTNNFVHYLKNSKYYERQAVKYQKHIIQLVHGKHDEGEYMCILYDDGTLEYVLLENHERIFLSSDKNIRSIHVNVVVESSNDFIEEMCGMYFEHETYYIVNVYIVCIGFNSDILQYCVMHNKGVMRNESELEKHIKLPIYPKKIIFYGSSDDMLILDIYNNLWSYCEDMDFYLDVQEHEISGAYKFLKVSHNIPNTIVDIFRCDFGVLFLLNGGDVYYSEGHDIAQIRCSKILFSEPIKQVWIDIDIYAQTIDNTIEIVENIWKKNGYNMVSLEDKECNMLPIGVPHDDYKISKLKSARFLGTDVIS